MSHEKAKKIAGGTAHAVGLSLSGVLKFLLTLLLIILLTGLMFMCIFAYYVKSTLMEEVDLTLTDFTVELSTSILYRDEDAQTPDEEWKELCMIQGTKFRIWKDLDEIPENMQHAIVAIEDRRFYDHKGVDWYRTVGAFANMFLTMRNDFGGSTITQQLIKNLTQEDDITVQRKLMEIFRALELEKKYDKDELIEYYLNAVFFGRNCYGVEAAAQTYFGKSISDCTLAECASIAGITNNPSRYDPFVSSANNKERRLTILWEMYDQGYISHEEYVEAVNEDPKFVRSESSEVKQEIYSYYEETVIEDVLQDLMEQKGVNRATAWDMLTEGGYQIYSCYDPKVQAAVDEVYTDVSQLPKAYAQPGKNQDGTVPDRIQSAIVVMDPYTGEIVALSGGTGEKEGNFILNRATGALRSPGSSFKPLASYGPAMEFGLITASTEINDSPDIVLSGNKTWYPHNTPDRYDGWITIQQALAQSKNTAAAQIIDKLTPEVSFEFLQERLGFVSMVPDDCNYSTMALGEMTHGVTVREMTQAYCAFLNEGTFTYARTYTKVTDAAGNIVLDNEPKTIQAFSSTTANNMVALLQNNITNGIAGAARLNNMSAGGKTGTSSSNKNRYFAGFTPYYTAAVWTGYDESQIMSFYGNPALDIWKNVMNRITVNKNLAYKELPTGTYQRPTGIFGSKADEEVPPTPTPSATPVPTPEQAPESTPETPVVTDPPVPPETGTTEPDVVMD